MLCLTYAEKSREILEQVARTNEKSLTELIEELTWQHGSNKTAIVVSVLFIFLFS